MSKKSQDEYIKSIKCDSYSVYYDGSEFIIAFGNSKESKYSDIKSLVQCNKDQFKGYLKSIIGAIKEFDEKTGEDFVQEFIDDLIKQSLLNE